MSPPIRVMICDDSFTVRAVIARILRSDPAIEIISLVADGQKAVDGLQYGGIDVIVLDVEMPVMDGLMALPLLLRIDPGVRVIMASALTTAGGSITMRALQAGAADYVPKPTSNLKDEFAREILAKVKGQGRLRRAADTPRDRQPEPLQGRLRPSFPSSNSAGCRSGDGPAMVPPASSTQPGTRVLEPWRPEPELRPAPPRPPLLLAIGSSTGGPQALFAFFNALSAPLPIPVIVTQHMPPLFTRSLADHIDRIGPRRCKEAEDDELLLPDRIVIAPGDRHLLIHGGERGLYTRISDDPPENSCRPAVDPMLRSAALACNGRVLAVILTGMGQDGLRGSQALLEAGGCILAQDEASSVVWGMPGSVARAGLCHAILPVDELALRVMRITKSLS